ncbi:alpha/beta hydrolase [Acetobacter okinawensis]|uniref:alpha/beta hydrolase n=1 Tax=Acetobacter okinawensis TaxID=1076594 RepID=UPI0020A17F1B|nr:alpha/beta hydrolase [Acetobacter okinawensis]MCP1214397.1 alpha/beta hydrolase [Acetobacter okinawensis]
MADPWHVLWLSEGVAQWNQRRQKVKFSPDLSGVNFSDHLPSDFRDSPKASRYFEKINLSDADLSEANISSLNFYQANFSRAKLLKANLSKTNFDRANFKDATIEAGNVEFSTFRGAKFYNTEIRNTNFEHCDFYNSIVTGISSDKLTYENMSVLGASHYKSMDVYKLEKQKQKDTNIDINIKKLNNLEIDKKEEKTKFDVFYATNRRPIHKQGTLVDYDGTRGKELLYGVGEVIIPKSHRIGSLGSSFFKRLINRKDDRLTISSLFSLNEILFWSHIKDLDFQMKTKEIPTIFVHGYNTSFKDSIIRAAQIGYDIGLSQGIGLFSWASAGRKSHYSVDEATADLSKYHLATFISNFIENSPQKKINIISHSMGSRVTLGAFEVLSNGNKKVLKSINQVIFAAADIDAELMRHLAPHVITRCSRVTSYVCNIDLALKASKILHGYARAGFTPPIFTLAGMDTILVNKKDLGSFYHGYIGSSRSILSDIFSLLKNNTPPAKRFSIEPIINPNCSYWKIKE